MTELLTNSRLRAFRDCGRLHDLLYVQGIRPNREAEALRFGTLIHRGLEAYWSCLVRDENQRHAEEFGRDGHVHLALEAALAAIDGKAFDAFEQVRADAMISFYAQRWMSGDLADYEVLGVEAEFRAPLLNPETWAASKTWTLAGKVDVIVRRKEDGRVLVIDHKTTSDEMEGDDATLWAKLQMDSQPSQYVIGAEALGYAVDELMWDILKKPKQKPLLATPVESRKYTKDGKLYAAQREHDETPAEYGARIREALSEAPDRFFQRKTFPRAESQIKDFLVDAWAQSATMRESARLGRSVRNPDACHRYGTCPFWLLCSTGAKAENYPGDYIKVENVHPELSKEIA